MSASMLRGIVLCALAVGVALGHGGLTFPPPRNNHGNIDPRNWTTRPGPGGAYHSGGPCAGGACLWPVWKPLCVKCP